MVGDGRVGAEPGLGGEDRPEDAGRVLLEEPQVISVAEGCAAGALGHDPVLVGARDA